MAGHSVWSRRLRASLVITATPTATMNRRRRPGVRCFAPQARRSPSLLLSDPDAKRLKTYIAVRRPVDWTAFSEESSVAFCRAVGYADTTIVDFCRLWRGSMRGSFQEVRHSLAALARRTWSRVPQAELISAKDLAHLALDEADKIILTDDDDWLHPDVAEVPADAIWGSIALVKVLHPPARIGDPILIRRALDGLVYTNNSSFSGRTLARLGFQRLFEHTDAGHARSSGDYTPEPIGRYLSCANKHPCSATVIHLNLQAERFDLPAFIEVYLTALETAAAPEADWLQPYKAELIGVFRDCLP